MSRAIKLSILSIIGIIFVFATIILLSTEYASYAILTATVAVIFVSYAVIFYNDTKDHYSLYKNKLRKLINTYDSVLVKSEKLPDMENHNIIRVASMEDLIYAQMVIKKPIYFYEEERSCSFVLIDNPEICVYILKADSGAVTTTEIIIEEIRKQPEQKVDFDHAILADIENTTIIKLDNKKTYKVSPYRPGEQQVTKKVAESVEEKIEKVIEEAAVEQVEPVETPVEEPVKEYIKDITQVFEAINYVNAEIKEDLFIDIEPKKRRKKDQPVNLTKVEKEIDNIVELSNTKVLDLIKTEPVDTKTVKEVLEQKEQEKELIVEEEKREKTTHKQRRQNNNQRNNRKNNNQRTTRKRTTKKQ